MIGFLNKREKLQDKRGLDANTPLSAARYQSSRNYPWKLEWTSVLGSRAFLDVMYANWYNFFPLRPTRDFGLYDGPWGPGRTDTATGDLLSTAAPTRATRIRSATSRRSTPRCPTSRTAGRARTTSRSASTGSAIAAISSTISRSTSSIATPTARPTSSISTTRRPRRSTTSSTTRAWISDTWKLTDRLTLNLGARVEHYRDGWDDQEFTPNGHAVLAGWNDATYRAFVAPHTVEARTVSETTRHRAARRVRLRPDRRQPHRPEGVLRAVFNFNSADKLADQENPVGRAQLRYAFNDVQRQSPCSTARRSSDGLISTQGGGGFVRIDRDLQRPTARRSRSTSSARSCRRCRDASRTSTRTSATCGTRSTRSARRRTRCRSRFVDRGPDNITGTADDQTLPDASTGRHRSARIASITNPENNQADFNTSKFALNRRFADRWMLMTSFGYTWLNQIHSSSTTVSVRQRPDVQLPAGGPDVRRQRLRNLDAVELQGHRPLHAAVRRSACRDRGRCRAAATGAAR